MKIGIFFDHYQPFHETKDPGQLLLGLLDIGIPVVLFTTSKPELPHYKATFAIEVVARKQASKVDFWRTIPVDVILLYFLQKSNLPMIHAIKNSGKIVVIKADTDGRLAFPLRTSRWREWAGSRHRHWTTSIVKLLLREIAPRVFDKSFRIFYLIRNIELSDAIVIESPFAQANLAYILTYWDRTDLIEKVFVVPNPVADDIVKHRVRQKEKLIVTIGRWNDVFPKNTATMVRVLCRFLEINKDYEAVIIGSGQDIVKRLLMKFRSREYANLHIVGPLPHYRVGDFLGKAQILFMPSNWEGFPISAAEAVCMGCTIVGTPLESLHFLVQGGRWGTLSSDFTEEALLGALLADVVKWKEGLYSAEVISEFWRKQLSREAVAERVVQLCSRIMQKRSVGQG